jgi:hypothetical protein
MKIFSKPETRAGFSLMEVNMAVFVMSVGILSMIVLYPLGLRESTQGQADLKQSMLAEYLLHQAVGIASRKDLTWEQWSEFARGDVKVIPPDGNFCGEQITLPKNMGIDSTEGQRPYRIICGAVRDPYSQNPNRIMPRMMGIMVQSTDLNFNRLELWANNPIYYAEAFFQGYEGPNTGVLTQ